MGSAIKFYLNGEKKKIDFEIERGLSPTTTVLRYLREEQHMPGTKEGCGVGDCGACTVCIAEPKVNYSGANLFTELPGNTPQVHFFAANSCLLPLAALNGKHLYTIEWLSRDGKIHPIQKALMEKRGTQCGFCSPGMVMSAYAHYRNGRPFTREEIEKTLSGNLCRCTGYESILEAMLSIGEMSRSREPKPIFDDELSEAASTEFFFERDGIKYIKPVTLKKLLAYKAQYTRSTIIAGNSDIGIAIKKGMIKAPVVILDTSAVPELKQCQEFDRHIYIGSGTNIENFKNLLSKSYPASEPYLDSFASLQIRNCGTIGGNIFVSSPVGDIMPLLIALDAEIALVSEEGNRSEKASEFVIEYRKNKLRKDEIISAVIIPIPRKNSFLFCHKQSKRKTMDIATMNCCIWFETSGRNITKIFTGFGGMAAIPANSCSAEEFLTGKEATLENFTRAGEIACEDFKPLSDLRGSAAYRLRMVKNLFIKCFESYESSR